MNGINNLFVIEFENLMDQFGFYSAKEAVEIAKNFVNSNKIIYEPAIRWTKSSETIDLESKRCYTFSKNGQILSICMLHKAQRDPIGKQTDPYFVDCFYSIKDKKKRLLMKMIKYVMTQHEFSVQCECSNAIIDFEKCGCDIYHSQRGCNVVTIARTPDKK